MKKENIFSLITIIIIFILTFSSTGCAPTPELLKASYNGKYETVKELVEGGTDINITDKYGLTPLMWATYYGYYNIVVYLLEKGADPNTQTQLDYNSLKKGTTALMIAAYYGYIPIIRELNKYKADPNVQDSTGNTAVIYAELYHGFDMGKLVKGNHN